jgi:hypothetical protein
MSSNIRSFFHLANIFSCHFIICFLLLICANSVFAPYATCNKNYLYYLFPFFNMFSFFCVALFLKILLLKVWLHARNAPNPETCAPDHLDIVQSFLSRCCQKISNNILYVFFDKTFHNLFS